jgi:hypothetical protein
MKFKLNIEPIFYLSFNDVIKDIKLSLYNNEGWINYTLLF